MLHTYEWLPDDEEWRVGVVWKQRRWLPEWLRDHIWENWFEDLEQVMEMCVFVSYKDRLSVGETRKVSGREIRAFLRSMGMGATHGKGWATIEAPASRDDIAVQCCQLVSDMCKYSLVTAINERRPKNNSGNLVAGPKMGWKTCIHCGRTVWAEIHMKFCSNPECRRAGAKERKLRFVERRRSAA